MKRAIVPLRSERAKPKPADCCYDTAGAGDGRMAPAVLCTVHLRAEPSRQHNGKGQHASRERSSTVRQQPAPQQSSRAAAGPAPAISRGGARGCGVRALREGYQQRERRLVSRCPCLFSNAEGIIKGCLAGAPAASWKPHRAPQDSAGSVPAPAVRCRASNRRSGGHA